MGVFAMPYTGESGGIDHPISINSGSAKLMFEVKSPRDRNLLPPFRIPGGSADRSGSTWESLVFRVFAGHAGIKHSTHLWTSNARIAETPKRNFHSTGEGDASEPMLPPSSVSWDDASEPMLSSSGVAAAPEPVLPAFAWPGISPAASSALTGSAGAIS